MIRQDSIAIRLSKILMISIPWAMAASSVAGLDIGPIRHTGLLWMATIVAGFMLIPLRGDNKICFPMLVWLPFYAFSAISLSWSEMDWRNNIQMFIQMLVFPVIGIMGSYMVKNEEELEKYNIHYILATLIIGAFCVFFMAGPGRALQGQDGGKYVGFAERPAATSLIAIAAIFLAQIHKSPKLSIGMWLLCFVICIISESRMATLVLLMLWIIHPQLASIRTRIAMVLIVMVAGLAAFNTPIIQDRFFKKSSGFSGSGSIEDVLKGKFDSAGRFDAWPTILKKSEEAPWLGHGVGQSAPFVYSVWAPMDKPHNEYLKMLYDGGYVGLATFVFGLVGTLIYLSWKLKKDQRNNWANAAAFMAWWGFILMAVVDNPLVYGLNFLHPVFFLVGAAGGISRELRRDDVPSEDRSVEESIRSIAERRMQKIMLR